MSNSNKVYSFCLETGETPDDDKQVQYGTDDKCTKEWDYCTVYIDGKWADDFVNPEQE